MDSSSITDVRTGVISIIQEFVAAHELFKRWRKGRVGKKAVGQEECETSLDEGKTTIEGTFNRLSAQHGARFDCGDKNSVDKLIDIRKGFRDAVVEVLASSVAEKGGKNTKIDPIALRLASETAKKDTIKTIDELSSAILTGTTSPFRAMNPEDVLPAFPTWPGPSPKSSQASLGHPPVASAASSQPTLNPQTSQTSFDNHVPSGSASSSQTSLPFAPIPQRESIYSSASGWKMPDFENRGDSSTSLVTISSARSAFNKMFQKSVRPYYDITPVEPTPPVVPSFKCDRDSWDIVREGQAAVQRSWAVANNTDVEGRQSLYAHSAPLIQGPWASIWEDEPEPSPKTPLIYEREPTPPPPEAASPSSLLSPVRPGLRPTSAQGGKRVRSEPMLEFSAPTPRFRRHVSGPSDAHGR